MGAGVSRRTLSAAAYPRPRPAVALAALLAAGALLLLVPEPASAHHASRPHMPQAVREGEPQSYTILRNYCDRWP
jgi:hypothetical protein